MIFPDFARMHGLVGQFIDDGRLHRCRTEDKPRHRNGAYKWTGDWGWAQNWATHEAPVLWRAEGRENAPVPRDVSRDMERQRARRDAAAKTALELVQRCRTGTHDYLVRKGFRNALGLLDEDGKLVPTVQPSRPPYLVVPMRAHDHAHVQSVQWIDPDGVKLFMRNAEAWGGVHVMGRGPETWYCEGYATGLSLMAGAQRLYRQAQVVVCFSAANLKHVAMLGKGRRYVMADHDAAQKNGRPGAGQTAATETGLPWTMPIEIGRDANDVHVEDGLSALTKLMQEAYR